METQHIALAISGANFVLTWAVALYMYLSNKNKATNERIGALQSNIDTRLDDHVERIVALETLIEVAPTHDDLGKLHDKINKANDGISGLSGEIKGVNRLLGTIHEHLLRSK